MPFSLAIRAGPGVAALADGLTIVDAMRLDERRACGSMAVRSILDAELKLPRLEFADQRSRQVLLSDL